MSFWEIVIDILVLLTAALVLGTVAELLRQSAILGYLVAGMLVGPNVLGLVGEGAHVRAIAELGVALLLFSIGIEFSFRRLARLGRVALVGGVAQVVVTLTVAALVTAGLGLPFAGAVAVGAMVSLSSTACVVRVLLDRRAIDSIYGRNALGILLLQDVAVIPLMLLLIVLAGSGTPLEAAMLLGRTVVLGGVLVGAFFFLFNVLVPRLLNLEQWAGNRELPILLAIILAVGSATAAHAVDLPPAGGAFVAGVLLGGLPFAPQIRSDVGSLRTLLVTLFFSSIGMLAEPQWMAAHWHLVGGTVVLIIVGKVLIVWAVVRLIGFTHGLALATGLCLAQVGEFSFVLAELARGPAPLIAPETFKLIVSATITTLFLTPFLVAAAPRAADFIESRRAAAGPALGPPDDDSAPEARDIVIIGFGPAGQAISQALYNQHRDQIVVIDLSPRNARIAHRYGLAVHLGDATHQDVLERVGVSNARVVAVTIPETNACRDIIHLCRRLAPKAAVIVRSRYHVDRWVLELAGAREVLDEEEQVGLRIAATARKYLARPDEPPVRNSS